VYIPCAVGVRSLFFGWFGRTPPKQIKDLCQRTAHNHYHEEKDQFLTHLGFVLPFGDFTQGNIPPFRNVLIELLILVTDFTWKGLAGRERGGGGGNTHPI
jgi:hypothetical protein